MTTSKITFTITQAHIDEAYRRCHDEKLPPQENDPIALALQEATGEECSVGFYFLKVGKNGLIPQPKDVLEFKRDFDRAVIWGKEERQLPLPTIFEISL